MRYRASLFCREFEGRTLRENLGLPRPENACNGASKPPSPVTGV
jgi:hypothetical protein